MNEEDDITRAMPHAVGPEKSILSTMLQYGADFIPVAMEQGIEPAHFYQPAHAIIFDLLREIHEQGREIELVSFTQGLLDRGLLDRVGGPSALSELYSYAPSSAHFRHHLEMVREKFVLRELIHAGNHIIKEAFESPEDGAQILDQAEAKILSIRTAGAKRNQASTRQAVEAVIKEMVQIIHGEADSMGIPTGFPRLDTLSQGLKPGEVFVIAARPSMGKSALMMNIVEAVAVDQHLPALVFSMEMNAKALMRRMIFPRARISPASVSKGFKPTNGELARIQRASQELAEAPIFIDETEGITIGELRAKARRRKRSDGLALIAVDYLQLMRSRSRQAQNSREREVAEISAGIKGLAKELEVPILLLAQLNRSPESRSGKNTPAGIPRMSDLRESGSIEQDADMIGLLHRPAYYAETDEERERLAGRATLILAKNRNGETGSIPMTFIEQFTRFEEGGPVHAPEPHPATRSRFNHLEA